MFSKKADEAFAKEHARQVQQERLIDAAIKGADQITDPTEKLLALIKVSEDISVKIKSEGDEISTEAVRKRNKAALSGLGTSVAAGTAVGILLGPIGWVGVPVLVGGAAVTAAVSSKRRKVVEKRLEGVAGSHIGRMEKQKALVSEMTDAVVENNVKALSKSSHYQKLLALPGIADKFAAAAAKHIAVDKAPPAPVDANKKPEPLRKPPKTNYDHLKNAGK